MTRNSIPGTSKPMINNKSSSAGPALTPNIPTISNITPTKKEKSPRVFLLIAIKITLFILLIEICIYCLYNI